MAKLQLLYSQPVQKQQVFFRMQRCQILWRNLTKNKYYKVRISSYPGICISHAKQFNCAEVARAEGRNVCHVIANYLLLESIFQNR